MKKKISSYIVRLLPVILSLFYLNNTKSIKYELMVLLFSGIIVFYSSERTALFLFFVIYIFYFLISDKKIYMFIFPLLIFLGLFIFEKTLLINI